MKRILLVALITVLVLASSGCSAVIENAPKDMKEETLDYNFANPITKELGENISIAVDPRVESAYLVFEMISSDTGFSQFEGSDYMEKQINHFEKFKDHEVFNIARRMALEGFQYDAIPSALYLFNDDLTLKEGLIVDDSLLERAGGMEELESFMVALYDFRKVSDYDTYFLSNSPLYQEYLERAENYINTSSMFEVFSNFYGNVSGEIRITITPECNHGYGCSNKYKDRVELLPTLTVSNYYKDYIGFLLHEFSHPYVNPETNKRSEAVINTEKLFSKISGQMSSKAYNSWEIALNEHIVRANTIYMMGQIYGDNATKTYIEREKKDGFIYIESIYKSIRYYEENRDIYKDFSQYFDTLVSDIERIDNK